MGTDIRQRRIWRIVEGKCNIRKIDCSSFLPKYVICNVIFFKINHTI